MKRNLKKFISMLLVLTMIFTSITVSNTTAKADEELIQLKSTTTTITGLSSYGTVAWITSSTASAINTKTNFCGFLTAGTQDNAWERMPEGHVLYGKGVLALLMQGGAGFGAKGVTVTKNDGEKIVMTNAGTGKDATEGNVMCDGDCVAIDESVFNIGDDTSANFVVEVTKGDDTIVTLNLVVKKYEHIANYTLNLHQTEGQNAGQANFRFDWNKIDGAAKYKLTSLNADGTEVHSEIISTNLFEYYSAITTETVGETYTVTVTALDNDGNAIKNPDGEDVTESIIVNKRYMALENPDQTQELSDDDKATLAAIEPEKIADDDWIALNGISNNGSKVYASTIEGMGREELRGFHNGGNPNYNRADAEYFKNMDIFGFLTTGTNASTLIIDNKEYINPTYKKNKEVLVGNDCIYINQELINAGVGETEYHKIWAKGSNTVPFAIKVVGPSKAIDPDAPAKPVGLVVSETNPYYYSWGAVECDYYNIYVDNKLVGESTNANYDVVNYLSDNNFAAGTYKFGVSVVKDGHESEITEADLIVTAVNVTIGEKITSAVKGGTFTFPTDATGYDLNGELYAPGSKYTVTKDVTFEAVDIKATMDTRAGIRFSKDNPGLRFQTTITATKAGTATNDFEKYISEEGTLITTSELNTEKGNPTIESDSVYTVGKDLIQIKNNGWYNGQTGVYYGSVVGIKNHTTNFIARSYVAVKYADGTVKNIYSDMSGVRTVQQVAQAIKNDKRVNETTGKTYYESLSEVNKLIVDEFAGTETSTEQ